MGIVQNYLNDTSIPIEKRKSVQQQMRSGFDEAKMETILMGKYGDRFGSPSSSPMGSTATSIPSVAEREGWLGNLGKTLGTIAKNLPEASAKFVKETGLQQGQTAPLQHDKDFETMDERADILRKMDELNPASPSRLPLKAKLKQINDEVSGISKPKPEQKWYEPPPEEMGLDPVQRLGGAIKGIGEAAKTGLQTFGSSVKEASEGSEISQIGKSGINQAEKFSKTIEDAYNAGKIDDKEYERLKKVGQSAMQRSQGFKEEGAIQSQQGLTGAMKGLSEVAASPVTGGVTGAFKPEFEALGRRLAGNETATGAIKVLSDKWDQLDPSLQNSLATVLNLGGLGIGKAGAKIAGKQVINQGVRAGADIAEFGEQAARQLPRTAEEFMGGVKQGVSGLGAKIPKIGNNAKQAEKLKLAEDILRPLPTAKNLQIAAEKGRATLGTKKLFSGTKDFIENTPRMKQAAKTLTEHFPDLEKVSPILLPKMIKDKISTIAAPLKAKFETLPVSKDTKDLALKSWEKIKRQQAEHQNFSGFGLDKMQKTFEDKYLSQLTGKFKGVDGKYRQPTADDVWEIAKAYDKNPSLKSVKNANEASDAILQAQQESWIQNRQVLRKIMDDLAKKSTDAKIQKAFQDMRDLYEASAQILKNIKPTNKSGVSRVGEFIKGHQKAVLGTAIGGSGAALLMGD